MATIILSAAGFALGASTGGSILGLSLATIGRAAGAVLGRSIDERLLGSGSAPVETGRVDRFRLTGASEGAPLAQVHGRMRIGGQVIWATRFLESSETSGGGKGGPRQAKTVSYSYSVSLALALCAGEITRVGRVWADGVEVARDSLNMRVYLGSETQLPDPKMEAVEGAGQVPAYRGMAYVVMEDLALAQFGNRVPQFSFEVFRPAAKATDAAAGDLARLIKGVALIPGTGEYALATTPVFLSREYGEQQSMNVNTASGKTDFAVAIEALDEELPECQSVSLVVSWFGNDLRAGQCSVRPKVEQNTADAAAMPWSVAGRGRSAAQLVPRIADRPVYGGTPTDVSVIEAVARMRSLGKDVMFYPFILMDQLAGNTLPDPWTGGLGQPPLPWRGRITTVAAPGRVGSTDGTAAAAAEVATFFGAAQPAHFTRTATGVVYSGPAEWSLRRFILHYANLCVVAGGVKAFCIGSEMRGLTQIRGAGGSFPAVAAFRVLAAEVKAIVGPSCKVGYAADWSEYSGYQPEGTGDKLFHLDPLWADPAIDFIGIDNYMPLSDWRDALVHADSGFGSIYNLDYLTGNVAGGEGFDWYYHSPEARAAQIRTPISDGLGEPWIYRYKDIKSWWSNQHFNRVGGVRALTASPWVPQSKPVWFTEFGCAAIDKGANEPNKFLDPKSSESALPHYSNGLRDDFMQMQYIRAVHRHFANPVANPLSGEYAGRMVDMARAHVWAWDARPFPAFPANSALWSDGANYARGHWLNGRSTSRSLASLVEEICAKAGVSAVDTARLYGLVRGYRLDDTDTARAALQPLMVAYGFDAVERDGVLHFITRTGVPDVTVDPSLMAMDEEMATSLDRTRASTAEVAGRVQIGFVDAEADYEVRASEAIFPDEATVGVSKTELPLALTRSEGLGIAERWLAEARVARDTASFALPPSAMGVGAGHVVRITTGGRDDYYRVDRVDQAAFQKIEAVRVEPEVYRQHETAEDSAGQRPFVSAVPVEVVFLDLPLIKGSEVPHAPYVAMTARPWPGSVALYQAAQDSDYALSKIVPVPAVIGTTMSPLFKASPGLYDRGPLLRVRLVRAALSSVSLAQILAGANVAAVGDGLTDAWEVFQFADVTLVSPNVFDIGMRLRGQAGSDGVMPPDWPVGSRFVLMNGAVSQIELAANARGVAQHFRYGAAQRAIDDPTYRYRVQAFAGVGLRPYAVCHLKVAGDGAGGLSFGWIRRTRVDGDFWGAQEVPLGETVESYVVRVRQGTVIKREVTVTAPTWTYGAGLRALDALLGAYVVEVAQVSDRFGTGPFRAVTLGV